MDNPIVSWLFETDAVRVCPEGQPFWYTSGKLGPFYINTQFLYGSEAAANALLSVIEEACAGDKLAFYGKVYGEIEKQLAACRMATTELSPLENWKKFRIAYYIFIAAYTLSFIIPVINGWLLWVKLASEITFIAGSISAWNKAIRVDE